MKKRCSLKGILFVFFLLISVNIAQADDYLYVFGAPLGKTTYEDFSKILEDNEYAYISSNNQVAKFSGFYSGREAQIILSIENGYVDGLIINMIAINPVAAGTLYADLLYSFFEKYANYQYEQRYEGSETCSYFISNAGCIILKMDVQNNSCGVSITYISSSSIAHHKQDKTNQDDTYEQDETYEQDDTFQPDFGTQDDMQLSPKDIKDGDWSVSDEFATKIGRKGSYWFPTMRVICSSEGNYLLTIIRPANNGYFKVTGGDDCYIRLENDSVVTLKLNAEYSPWRYEREGYYQSGVYMKKRYMTQTFYDIEDITILLNNNIIKIRWIEDDKPYDIDYKENKWVKDFNKSFHNAIQQASKKAQDKMVLKEDKLHGF